MSYTNVDLLRGVANLDPTPGLVDLIADRIAAKLTKEGITPVESDLVDAKDAARIMGISVSALYKRVERGQMPPGSVQFIPGTSRMQFVRGKLVQPSRR